MFFFFYVFFQYFLVGGLEHEFYVSIYWVPTDFHIFRGVGIPPTRDDSICFLFLGSSLDTSIAALGGAIDRSDHNHVD